MKTVALIPATLPQDLAEFSVNFCKPFQHTKILIQFYNTSPLAPPAVCMYTPSATGIETQVAHDFGLAEHCGNISFIQSP